MALRRQRKSQRIISPSPRSAMMVGMGEAIGGSIGMVVGLILGAALNWIAWSHSVWVGILAAVASVVIYIMLMIGGSVLGNSIRR